MIAEILTAIQTFLLTQGSATRGHSIDEEPPYIVWDMLDEARDGDQENYADTEQGQEVVIAVSVWGESDLEAVSEFDSLRTALQAANLAPTGLRQIRRPKMETSQLMEDPDTHFHRVYSRWYLCFTKTA